MIQFNEDRIKSVVESLKDSAEGRVALFSIAEEIEVANDNCCGCGWPSHFATLLRGDSKV